MARRFTADAITPLAAEWDEKHVFPKDTIRAAAELGFARSTSPRNRAASGSGGSRRR
jgi:alkylation response protein AidB-like acyl-CoA dehydrogenase